MSRFLDRKSADASEPINKLKFGTAENTHRPISSKSIKRLLRFSNLSVCHLGFVGRILGTPAKSRPYLGVFIIEQTWVGIDVVILIL